MIICYKTHYLTYLLAKLLVKVKYIGLPNLLANRALVPELIQSDFTPESLSQALINLLKDQLAQNKQIEAFTSLHLSLRQDSNAIIVKLILDSLGLEC